MMNKSILCSFSFLLIMSSCKENNKGSAVAAAPTELSQKQILQIDTAQFKADPAMSTFYAICFEEHGGWCSSQYSKYSDAQAALDAHRAGTGHTDNTISNDCPFSGIINYDSMMIQAIKQRVNARSKEDLDKIILEKINPLAASHITFDSVDVRGKTKRLFGGGNQVSASALSVLGGSTAGTTITVTVSGSASVRISMWFTLAQIPAGTWVVAGPGSSTFQLNCNVTVPSPGCPIWFGQPVTVQAQGINGKFPVWVSFN